MNRGQPVEVQDGIDRFLARELISGQANSDETSTPEYLTSPPGLGLCCQTRPPATLPDPAAMRPFRQDRGFLLVAFC